MSGRALEIAELYASEHGRLRRFIRRLIGSPVVAEDLVQDVFLAFLRRDALSHPVNSPAYLTRIARNLAVDHLRREQTRARYSEQVDNAEALACDQPLPDTIVQGRQELAALLRVIDELPTKCRVVFLLSREHGLTMKQIAESLGITEKTVEKHLMRAMVDCRRALQAIGRNV